MFNDFFNDEIVEQLEWYNVETTLFFYFIYSLVLFILIYTSFFFFLLLFIFFNIFKNRKKVENRNRLLNEKSNINIDETTYKKLFFD